MANRNKNRRVINIQDVNVRELRNHFAKGRIATVVFTKKGDGSTRVLNGKTNVQRGMVGGEPAYDAESRGQLRVFDVNAKDANGVRTGGYRTVTAQNVQEIRANGNIYKVVGGGEPALALIQGVQFSNGVLRLVINGNVYRYFGVPREIHIGLVDAPNKGSYFNSNIRGKFDYVRVA